MAHLTQSVEYASTACCWLAGGRHAAEQPGSGGIAGNLPAPSSPRSFRSWRRRGSSRPAKGSRVTACQGAGRPSASSSSSTPSRARSRCCECQEIRGRCAVFDDRPPDWATSASAPSTP
uniref:Uncharacterized 12.3 kDa protein in nifK-nifY intergenic region n=1 Tax=Azospirillum brasilense TaxID=192 RepID=YNIF_AZOBR|nr:RecName: Full=Uncharacterized 12.3 kDa protein in nifK-nifY intergenic region [Azospirillum brasilense]AAB02345.1 orf1 [Azospirillum brasilense]